MSFPSPFQSLPGSYAAAKPLLDQVLQQQAAAVVKAIGSTKKPYPPRSLIVQQFSNGAVLASWELPVKASDVVGFNVYINSEFAPQYVLKNRAQTSVFIIQVGSTAVWVSCFNANAIESQKVGAVVLAGGAPFNYNQDFLRRSRLVGGG